MVAIGRFDCINMFLSVKGHERFSDLESFRHLDDPEGSVHQQHQLHRPADHGVHEGAAEDGERTPQP